MIAGETTDVLTIGTGGITVPHGVRRRHTQEEWKRIRRVLRVRETREGWELRPKSRYAGAVVVDGQLFYVPPPFPVATLLGMVLIAEGLDELVDQQFLTTTEQGDGADTIFQVLSALVVLEAERIAAGHVAQGYMVERERLSTIRGRPNFKPHKPRPPDGRVLCDFWNKSTDIALNRVLLAGLIAASRWLQGGTWNRRCRTQRFVWSSLAESSAVTRAMLVTANRSINRLTDHYRTGIATSAVLLFGWDPQAVHAPGARIVPAPMFDLATLFEPLIERLVSLVAKRHGLIATPQVTHRRAMRDATGATYRKIRPDVLISAERTAVAVVDAKFKPRYVSGGPGSDHRSKVTREDLFQMFFYGERIRRQTHENTNIPAIVIAPKLPGAVPPQELHRRITWSPEDDRNQWTSQVIVVPVDLVRATAALVAGDADGSIEAATELDGLLATF